MHRCNSISFRPWNIKIFLHSLELIRIIDFAFQKEHPWVTVNGARFLPSTEENCDIRVEITDEEVRDCVRSVPSLNTLIMVKSMLRKHSFSNPFSSKEQLEGSSEETNELGKQSRNQLL